MGQMTGKHGLVMGVANDRSIAWGIAKALADAGAELAFSYQGEAFGKRVEPLAASVGSDILIDVDQLGEDEGVSWVWHGANCLAPEYTRCLVSLSPGGTVVLWEIQARV